MYPKGRIYVIHEHVMSGRGVKNQINQHTGEVLERGHASYVLEIEQAQGWHPVWRYADPQHVFSKKAEGCLAEQWLECGYHLSPWPRTGTNEEAMVEKVRLA
jgi:hypothetical protein